MLEKAKRTETIRLNIYHFFTRTALVLASIVITLVALELILPVFFAHINKGYLQQSQLKYSLEHLAFGTASQENWVNGHQDTSQLEWMEQDVMHPYLGFVRNPQEDVGYDKYGFLGEETIYKRSPDTVIVGLFGGSVAWYLFLDTQKELISELQKIPEYQGKQIKIVSVALGGYKQPQQSLALNYILNLGGEFDVVINVDGFNDAALPYSDNFAAGITPMYPRAWDVYSRKSVDLPTIAIIGETSNTQAARATWAAKFQRTPLKYSQLALLVWYLRDAQMNQKLQALDAQLQAKLQTQAKTVQVQGPTPPETKEQVFSDSLNVWRDSSLQMARLAASNGARYYHVLQPNQYLPDSKTLNETEKKTAYVATLPDDSMFLHAYRYKEAVEKVYPEMRKAGQQLHDEHNISFFDMTQLFKDVKDTIYIDPCCHYNTTGSKMLIQKLGELIRADYAQEKQQQIK